MHARHQAALVLVPWVLAACAVAPPPLYDGLGESGRLVSTEVVGAQAYFDQGLALCWGFNHDEAVRSFEQVARLDPDCAMAHWGVAFALGPNINGSVNAHERASRAHDALEDALDLLDGASEIERALIEALVVRFDDPPPEDRSEYNLAYEEAMRAVWKRFPDDVMVGTLFADAQMNVNQDWRSFGTDEERGERTQELIGTLELVLGMAPDHAGANHLYIHAVEGSDRPERALAAANKLEELMPAAGHMVHMPSHIYMRLGMYDESVEANTRAVAEDDSFFAQAPRQAIYHLYRAHNHHFIVWSAMFRGSFDDAMAAARTLLSKLPDESDGGLPSLESYRFVPMHVLMRFGRWEQMLAEPGPGDEYPIATALWHHGRGVAFANLNRFAEARSEADLFESIVETLPSKARVRSAKIGVLMEVARQVMWGEILFKEGDREAGLAALRKGVEVEDSMPYAEPPSWMQPIRHSLGALLLEDGQVEDAMTVYRADLERHAENVWSLHGLAESLRRLGREREAQTVQARFDKVAQRADVPIRASCYCRTPDA